MSKARDIADLDFNSPDIDGGNIDGAVIGANTPAAGTFTSVTADGLTVSDTDNSTLKLESTDTSLSENQVVGQIQFYANDASTNSTGNKAFIKAYSETAGGNKVGLDFATSSSTSATGVVAMTINSSGDVGIGTNSPSRLLTLSGTEFPYLALASNTTGGSPAIFFGDSEDDNEGRITYSNSQDYMSFSTAATERLRITSDGDVFAKAADARIGSDSGSVEYGTSTANSVRFYSNNLERLRLTSSGNVKIGTGTDRSSYLTASTANLQIDGGVVFEPGSGNNVEIFNYRATDMLFGNSGTEAMRIDSSGRVGIGTDSPSGLLHVASTGAANIKIEDTDNGFAATELNVENGGRDFKITTPQDTIFVQGSTEAARIDASGNVGIGTSSPSRELEVTGSGNVYIKATAPTANDSTAIELANTGETWTIRNDDTNSDALEFGTSGGTHLTLDTSGNVGINQSSPTVPLDFPTDQTGMAIRVGDDNVDSYMTFSNPRAFFGYDVSSNSAVVQGGAGKGLRFNVSNGTFGSGEAMRITADQEVIINEDSQAGGDFRVESDSNTHAIFVNAGANGVGFGATASTVGSSTIEGMYYEIGGSLTVASNTETLQINRNGTGGNNRVNIGLYNNGTKRGEIGTYGAADGMFFYTGSTVDSLRLTAGEAVFNDGRSDINFRVESDSNANALFVDGSNGTVNLGGNTQQTANGFLHLGGIKFNNGSSQNGEFFSWDNEGGTGSQSLIGYWFDGSEYRARMRLAGETTATVFNESSEDIDFRVESNTQTHMLFVDAGNNRIGVNQSSPSGTFSVKGTSDADNVLRVVPRVLGTGLASSETTAIFQSQKATCIDLNRFYSHGTIVQFRHNNDDVGRIDVNATSTTYVTSSDARLKENIVDAPSSSDDIDAIQVRSFDWKTDGSHQKYGMVAQELQTVAPEAVSGSADSDEMMGVDYSKLVPMLVKEIQSLRNRVAKLEGE